MCIDKRIGCGRAIEKIAHVSFSPSCFGGTQTAGYKRRNLPAVNMWLYQNKFRIQNVPVPCAR